MPEGNASARTEIDARWGQWMAAAQAGDRASYDALLRACIPLIRAVARQQGVAPDGVDDVVQETLITIHRARQTYDPSRSFTAWLRTIAQRRAIDGLRSRGRRRAMETFAPVGIRRSSGRNGRPRSIRRTCGAIGGGERRDRRLAGRATRSGGASGAARTVAGRSLGGHWAIHRRAQGQSSSRNEDVTRAARNIRLSRR